MKFKYEVTCSAQPVYEATIHAVLLPHEHLGFWDLPYREACDKLAEIQTEQGVAQTNRRHSPRGDSHDVTLTVEFYDFSMNKVEAAAEAFIEYLKGRPDWFKPQSDHPLPSK